MNGRLQTFVFRILMLTAFLLSQYDHIHAETMEADAETEAVCCTRNRLTSQDGIMPGTTEGTPSASYRTCCRPPLEPPARRMSVKCGLHTVYCVFRE